MKKDIMSYNIEELKEEMLLIGAKSFRANQIYEWIHIKMIENFDEMTNISKELREKLKENYDICMPHILKIYKSKLDGTCKFLFEMYDGVA